MKTEDTLSPVTNWSVGKLTAEVCQMGVPHVINKIIIYVLSHKNGFVLSFLNTELHQKILTFCIKFGI
jgi:hypothetical protein